MDGTLHEDPGPPAVGPQADERPAGRTGPDRCPGLLELHPAADGLLARLRVPGGRITSAQLAVIADLAERGNGIVELTSRANVQVRGLTVHGSSELVARLAEVGLLPSPAHERVRNVLASPLAGRHPGAVIAVDELVTAIDRGLCADPVLAGLPGRFLFVVEDGSGMVAGFEHDIALTPAGGMMALLVDGTDSGLRAHDATGASEMALRAARAFLAAARDEGDAWRVRDLAGGAAKMIGRLAAFDDRAEPSLEWRAAAPSPLTAGGVHQRDGQMALTALAPLGRLSAVQLRGLAGAAEEIRISPWRTVSVLDLDASQLGTLERELSGLGLVVDPDSGWRGLSACAGRGACRSARGDVRAAASARAEVRAPVAPAEHWAGCPRRCGQRSQAIAVAIVDGGVSVHHAGGHVVVEDFRAAFDLLEASR